MLDWADGWAPLPFPDVPERAAELRRRAAEAGRDVTVMIYGLGSPPEPADLAGYAEAGVDGVVYHVPSLDAGETERLLGEIRAVIDTAGR